MTSHFAQASSPRSLRIIAAVAVVWNLIGVASYLMAVTMGPQTLASLPPQEQVLYRDIPAWATASYAVAVFGGTAGSVGLWLRRAWSPAVLAVSLLAILLQMGHALLMTELLAVRGPSAALLPALIVAIGAYLFWYARAARIKGWLA